MDERSPRQGPGSIRPGMIKLPIVTGTRSQREMNFAGIGKNFLQVCDCRANIRRHRNTYHPTMSALGT